MLPVEEMTFDECVQQAVVCAEEAREAARLKRYQAARGLFTTALDLYRMAGEKNLAAAPQMNGQIHQLEAEILVYSELARSMEKPLRR